MNHRKFAALLAACTLSASPVSAAITISTNNSGSNGRLATSFFGNLLTSGQATLHIGYFLNPDDPLLKDFCRTNLSNILQRFIPLGENRPGLGATGGNFNVGSVTPGRWNTTITGITGTNEATAPAPSTTTLVQGTRLFLLIIRSPNEYALFGDSVLWRAPKDDPSIPGGASLTLAANISNLDTASASTELYVGAYQNNGTQNFIRLDGYDCPEPGTASLGLLTALGLLRHRRRTGDSTR